ncbi:MAG: hypothetical protein V4642_12650 [Bacteroidota bacterium]
MLIRIFILIAVLLVGCVDDDERTMQPLTFDKTPYTGNELRTDGYYYTDLTSENDISVVVLYRDGVCIRSFSRPEGQEIFDHIEGILLNKSLIAKLWERPMNVGIFQVNNDSLKYDIWEPSTHGSIITLSHFCQILNDTTFVQTKLINRSNRETFPENLTYRFKQFSPKPDSTNSFIK